MMTCNFEMIINGNFCSAAESLQVINPATEETIGSVPRATKNDLDKAVAAARAAFPGWSALALVERSSILLKIADVLEEHSEMLAKLITLEQGKPLHGFGGMGARFEMLGAVGWCRATAALELPVRVIQDNQQARIELHRKPVGVVGSITPWNFPLMIAIWHTMPALLAGNTVVLKPSEFTPLSTLQAAALINGLLPPGVFNVLSGDGTLGAAISAHPDINKIVFTGSTATGKRIMQTAADSLKRLTLELGGNDAGIVLADVDVDDVAPKLFAAAFINGGQTCAALKRLYVHEDIHEALCDKLLEIANRVSVGNGLDGVDFGPVQNRRQFEKVCAIAADAKARGGRFLCGGERQGDSGYFFPVTLVTDLDDDARLVAEEPFGPILPILRFSDLDEVIARANASLSGLGGSVWSRDTALAQRLAARLECGTAWVNNHAAIQPDAPFGGVKQSGIGVEFGELGLEEYTVVQTLQIAKS